MFLEEFAGFFVEGSFHQNRQPIFVRIDSASAARDGVQKRISMLDGSILTIKNCQKQFFTFCTIFVAKKT
jgi:hypothetical protein